MKSVIVGVLLMSNFAMAGGQKANEKTIAEIARVYNHAQTIEGMHEILKPYMSADELEKIKAIVERENVSVQTKLVPAKAQGNKLTIGKSVLTLNENGYFLNGKTAALKGQTFDQLFERTLKPQETSALYWVLSKAYAAEDWEAISGAYGTLIAATSAHLLTDTMSVNCTDSSIHFNRTAQIKQDPTKEYEIVSPTLDHKEVRATAAGEMKIDEVSFTVTNGKIVDMPKIPGVWQFRILSKVNQIYQVCMQKPTGNRQIQTAELKELTGNTVEELTDRLRPHPKDPPPSGPLPYNISR